MVFSRSRVALLFIALSFVIPIVSAVSIEESLNSLKQGATEGLSFLFSTREIATKTLFGIILFMVLYTSVDAIFKKKWYFTSLMTFVVTLLAVVWLPDDFISTIRLQYGAVGAAVLTILPLLAILAFTIRVQSALVGRVLWVFYALYYFGLLFYKTLSGPEPFLSASHIPYFAAIIGGIVMFTCIPAIRNAIFKGQLAELKSEGAIVASRAKLLHKLQQEELEGYDVKKK